MFGFFKKNDWTPVWSHVTNWDSTQGNFYHHGFKPVSYEIQFSKVRNKLRLNCMGFEPNLHPAYSKAIEMLNHLKITLENEIPNPKE